MRTRTLVHALLLAGAAVVSVPASRSAAQAGVPGLTVEPCTLPGVSGPARCGTLQVWENRTAGSGRRIPLRFVVIPGTGPGPARVALTYLSGGPGTAATSYAASIVALFAASREGRDILLVDQRGTGGSHRLNCAAYSRDDVTSYLGAFLPADRVRACVPGLQGQADLAHYTTGPVADDLDQVRAALGYERLDLYGGSYGTRAALVYMRRHPQRVRSAILLGVAPTDASMPLTLPRDTDHALFGVVADCEAEAACRAAFPRLRADVGRSLERFAGGPVQVDVVDPATGRPVRIALTRDLYAEAVRYLLYTAGSARLVPAMVHQAAAGDFGPIAEAAIERRMNLVDAGSHGVYLAVTCAEDVPYVPAGEGERLARGTFLGDYRLRDQRAACAAWPRAPIDPGFRDPVVSDAPTLVLSGQYDPATPPRFGEQVARHLAGSLHVVVPSGAHGFAGMQNSSCVDRLMNDFVRAASAAALDTACVRTVRRPPFRTEPIETRVARVEPAELARLAGEYGEGGSTARVTLVDGSLEMVVPQGRWMLAPLSPTRFRVAGLANLAVEFEVADGSVRAVRTSSAGVPLATLARR
ncbi:MAG TPA: alpha/beta hydrolase [Longimicrobiaceae bacterium]|jgi:pimeloyl-ACP methyl ester carboxylesterase